MFANNYTLYIVIQKSTKVNSKKRKLRRFNINLLNLSDYISLFSKIISDKICRGTAPCMAHTVYLAVRIG